MLQLRTLGDVRLTDATGELLAGRRKELVLLVHLARRSPRALAREELATLLWGDTTDARARHSLRQALLDLKHALGPSIDIERHTVALREGALELDLTVVGAELAAGRLEAAVARWNGEFLAGLDELGGDEYRAWVRAERDAVRRQVAWALERLIDDAERRGDWRAAAEWADRLTQLQPLQEAPRRRLIEALHRGDRTAEALAQHARFIAQLQDTAGRRPSAEFLQLSAAIEHRGRVDAALAPAPGSAALFTPDLVGRESELGELHAAWRAARQGSLAVTLMEGEEGLGKTRLVESFLREIEQAGDALILRARGEAAGDTVNGGYALARNLLAPLRDAPGLGGASQEVLAEVSALVPAIRDRFPALPPATGTSPGLHDAVTEVIEIVAAEQPVLLAVDDLEVADEASGQLILALAQRMTSSPVLLLVTSGHGNAAVSALRSLPRARRFRLRALSVDDIESLIGSMIACPSPDRRALAELLLGESGGNPMFVSEMVAALVDEGRLAPDAQGRWRLVLPPDGSPLPLPASVREVLERRVAMLTDDERAVLSAAAALPQPFTMVDLSAAVALSDSRARAAADRLLAGRLFRQDPRTGRYTFAHGLIRRVAHQQPMLDEFAPSAQGEETASVPASEASQPATAARARPGWALWAAAAVLLLAVATVWARDRAATASAAPVLAVGLIRDYAGTDSATAARALPEMLATNLAQLSGMQVVSQARMYEILEQLGGSDPTAAALAGAARRSGARELIEGELYHPAGRSLRLELRHVDLQSGRVRTAYTIEARDVFALVDNVTEHVARVFGRTGALPRITEAMPASLVAFRMYEEGLRAHYKGELPTARTFFRAALQEDEGFGLAAYYLWLTERQMGLPVDSSVEELISRFAAHAPHRERLLMRGLWASITLDPALTAIAETLVTRYPAEPDGHLLLGEAYVVAGDFGGALPHLRQVVTLDSLSLAGRTPRCRACDAFSLMIAAHSRDDSLAAAERVAREWVRLQPASGRAWAELRGVLEAQDRHPEALAAQHQGAPLRAGSTYDPVYPAILAIRAGDFSAADRLLREQAAAGTPAHRRQALWFWTISLRTQGRLREALQTARALRQLSADSLGSLPSNSIAEAQVLFEMGRFREAAALFDSLASTPDSHARRAFQAADWRAWRLTHAATALARAGDTAALARLADSIQGLTAQSVSARNRRLHHYVRGLLLVARDDLEQAAVELRRALYSLPYGYSRNNVELAKVLRAQGKAGEAVGVLQPAFRGWIEVGGLYATRAELHAELGHGFEAAGRPDSAAAHYRWVLRAWAAADPELHARRDSVRLRLAGLERRLERARPPRAALSARGVSGGEVRDQRASPD